MHGATVLHVVLHLELLGAVVLSVMPYRRLLFLKGDGDARLHIDRVTALHYSCCSASGSHRVHAGPVGGGRDAELVHLRVAVLHGRGMVDTNLLVSG